MHGVASVFSDSRTFTNPLIIGSVSVFHEVFRCPSHLVSGPLELSGMKALFERFG